MWVELICISMCALGACSIARSYTCRVLSFLPLHPLPASVPLPLVGFSPKPLTTHLSIPRSSPFLHFSLFRSRVALLNGAGDDGLVFEDDFDSVGEEDGIDNTVKVSPERLEKESGAGKFPLLTSKEKKELRAYAHGLGKKLVSQQVGKAGVTSALVRAISDTLEANEILKLRVLDNCPDELEDVTRKIEEATQAQMVGKIGSILLLYRPSLRKSTVVEKQQNKSLRSPIRRSRKFT